HASVFIAADAANRSYGFFMKPKTAFAYRQTVGDFGVVFGGERGNVRLWDDRFADPTRAGYRNYGYSLAQVGIDRRFGPAKLTVSGSYLRETTTILGATGNIWTGETGAKSWFVDTRGQVFLGHSWRLGGQYRHGWTRIGAAGMRPGADWIRTDAWSADLTRLGLFSPNDQLALRFSQPLRVADGGVRIDLPTSYDYTTLRAGFETQYVSLTPDGREQNVELAYATPMLNGNLGANLYWRREPGNLSYAPNDIGIALRFNRAF
ncbi:MAG: hypothetical protein ACRCY3_03430, partial [Sphingorhabdus sp.]